MYRKSSVSSLVMLSALLSSPASIALDESRLWLPKSYERIYLDLKRAAEAAEKLNRCVKVLRGTIDLEKSTKDHPIFRIQCRQENGRTYNEMVDGLTKETLTTVEVDVDLDEERLENQKRVYWAQCKNVFNEKTELFTNRKVLDDDPEPESFSFGHAVYRIRFDAEDIDGNALKYYALCSVNEGDKAKVRIKKRYDRKDAS